MDDDGDPPYLWVEEVKGPTGVRSGPEESLSTMTESKYWRTELSKRRLRRVLW